MALENKLGITNPAEIAKAEERLSKKKAIALFDYGYLDLSLIHIYNKTRRRAR